MWHKRVACWVVGLAFVSSASAEVKDEPGNEGGGLTTGSPEVFERAKLVASDGADEDRFGTVAISGDAVIVGSRHDDDLGEQSGSAYVFVRQNDEWAETAKLLALDGAEGAYFGESVAMSGDTAIIGAIYDGDLRQGAAYVFVRVGDEWTEQSKLVASDGALGDEFGFTVSIDGDTAIVGASGGDDSGEDSGSAYVFVRQGDEWIVHAKLLAPDGRAGDRFGWAVAVSGDKAIVGAPEHENIGTAYVYARIGGAWIVEGKLLAADGEPGDSFGHAITLSGETALVGTQTIDFFGGAYIFARDCCIWTERAKLTGADASSFGSSVALSGDTAIIGEPGGAYGAAYIFIRDGDEWPERTKLLASDGTPPAAFGAYVGVSGATAIVGDPLTDRYTGSAYIFELADLCSADVDGSGVIDIHDLLIVLAQWGECPPVCPGDVNGDGVVEFKDLLLVLAGWGPCD